MLLTEVNFPSTIFDNTQATGADLRFTSDEAGTTELAFEIVNWDTTNDKAEVWVKIPTVDCDDDTTFYVWYGNSGASAYAADATYGSQAVWADYEGVWHLTNANDSSANEYNLTPVNSPTTTSGLIGTATTGAYSFTHSSKQLLKIEEASCSNLAITGSRTFSCWAKATEQQAYFLLGKCGTTGATLSYGLWVLADTGNKKIIHHNGSMTPWYVQSTPGSYPYNVTYFIVGVYDSSAGKSRLYVNGTKFEVSVTGTVVDDGDFAIGNVGSFSEWDSYFSGPVDDVKVRDTAVSDDWVITEYNNQSSPATFITEGTEEDVGGTSVTITPAALALTSVINDGTISTVRNITTILLVQSLTSSVPTPTINTTINTTVTLNELTLTSSQPNCTVYPPTTTTANNVIYMANRDRIAIKLNDSGTVYLELD